MKVYCYECEYFSDIFYEECKHRNNLGNYRSRYGSIKEPCVINKDNDCKWFEKEKTPKERRRERRKKCPK
jgi:hypothetical protein